MKGSMHFFPFFHLHNRKETWNNADMMIFEEIIALINDAS